MKITFLGTGNARGFPPFGCKHELSEVARADQSLRRSQSAVLLETPEGHLLLDAGRPDLCHLLDADLLRGICISHFHSDHVMGLLTLKWGKASRIPVYHPEVDEFYADLKEDPGILDFRVAPLIQNISIPPFSVTALPLLHNVTTQGYLVEYQGRRLAYLCDTCDLPAVTVEMLKTFKPQLSIIDCNQAPGKGAGSNHNDLPLVEKIKELAELSTIFITHIGGGMERCLREQDFTLPENIHEAQDGLCIDMG